MVCKFAERQWRQYAASYVWYVYLLFSDVLNMQYFFFFFSSRRRHTRSDRDWSSDVCSSDLAGVLGEWELTASVSSASNRTKEFSGPLTMRHTGICTQDGPEEKTGEIRLQVAEIGRASCRERV